MTDELAAQLAAFDKASTAEEYLDILEITYDPTIINVNRLHILKKFGSQIEGIRSSLGADADPADLLVEYRQALQDAYQTFLDSTPLEERLFKVLQDHAPTLDASNFVPVESITVKLSEA